MGTPNVHNAMGGPAVQLSGPTIQVLEEKIMGKEVYTPWENAMDALAL